MPLPEFQLRRTFVPEEPYRQQMASGVAGRAIGSAIENAGEALGKLAELYRKDNEQLDRFQALRILDEAKTNAEIRLQEMQNEMQPGARDFSKNFKLERDKIIGSARAQIPAKLQAEFEYKFDVVENDLRQRAFMVEQKERERYYKFEIDKSLNDFLTRIDQEPDTVGDVRQQGEELIDASGLNTFDKEAITQAWRANSSIAYFNTMIRDDPEKATLALGGRARITDPEKLVVASKIRAAAQEAGIDPDMAVAVAYQESGLRSDLKGPAPGTKIKGLFQLDASSQIRHGYEPGLEGNIRSGLADMKERINAFRRDFGRDPNVTEYYIYHYQGIGAGKAIMKADPSESLYDLLATNFGEGHAKRVFKSNPWLNSSMTVGQFKNWVTRKMNNALAVTGGQYNPNINTSDPILADIPYDKRLVLRNKAEAEFYQRQNQEYTLTTRLQNKIEEQTYKNAIDLYHDNKLTPQWVEDNVRNLSATQYKTLMALANKEDDNRSSDFATYLDLLRRADAPNESASVIQEASEAVGKGLLNRKDFDKIYGIARRQENIESGAAERRAIANDVERYIEGSLKPRGLGAIVTPELAEAKERVKLDFLEWRLRNPNAPLSDMRAYADQLIEKVRLEEAKRPAIARTLRALNVKSINEVTPQMLEKFGTELVKRKGNYTDAQYKQLLLGLTSIEALIKQDGQ